jgi:hypothetical protein
LRASWRLTSLGFNALKFIVKHRQSVRRVSVTPKSGLFLAGSCVAAIAAVGSIFELSSGSPDWGTGPTIVILGLCVPLVGLLFYAAVKDANKANQP